MSFLTKIEITSSWGKCFVLGGVQTNSMYAKGIDSVMPSGSGLSVTPKIGNIQMKKNVLKLRRKRPQRGQNVMSRAYEFESAIYNMFKFLTQFYCLCRLMFSLHFFN